MKRPLIACFLLACNCVNAQKTDDVASQPLPQGALLASVPKIAQWKITASNSSSTKSQSLPTDAKSLVVTKNGHSYYTEIQLETGSEMDEWWIEGIEIIRKKGDAVLVVPRQNGDIFYTSFAKSDFPDVDWLSPETYVGIQQVGGHKCMVFKNETSTAWVDVDTRLPVQFAAEGKIETYTFLAPPSGMFVIPDDVQKQLAFEKKWQTQIKMAPRP